MTVEPLFALKTAAQAESPHSSVQASLELDANLYRPSLPEGVFGSDCWMASRMGISGKSRSMAKTTAAQENAKEGDRPKQKEAFA